MNKSKLRITAGDLKRCDQAMAAVRHIAKLQQCKRFPSAGEYAAILLDRLERLKLIYAGLVGSVLGPQTKLVSRDVLRGMVGMVNQLYGLAYPAANAAKWRSEILKPITLTIERVDWQETQR